jgi:hypothetical protein
MELRCCYFIQGWNLHNVKINSLDEWANTVGWLAFYANLDESSRDEDKAAAVHKAKVKAVYLISFVRSFAEPAKP